MLQVEFCGSYHPQGRSFDVRGASSCEGAEEGEGSRCEVQYCCGAAHYYLQDCFLLFADSCKVGLGHLAALVLDVAFAAWAFRRLAEGV